MALEIDIADITSQWAQNNYLHVFKQDELDSTNQSAKDEAFSDSLHDETTALYICKKQKNGRGRGENVWINEPDHNNLFSTWSFLIKGSPQPILSPLVGLALYKSCYCTWPFLAWNSKAPNDIYLNDKKVGGILIENVQQGEETRVLIGIGLNVYSHPNEVLHATSIDENLDDKTPILAIDWLSFLDRLLFEITDVVSHSDKNLNPTQQQSLLHTLNMHPLLNEKYVEILPNGGLSTSTKITPWNEL